ncbi:MAG: hypothetical protein V1820_04570 [archaeon]
MPEDTPASILNIVLAIGFILFIIALCIIFIPGAKFLVNSLVPLLFAGGFALEVPKKLSKSPEKRRKSVADLSETDILAAVIGTGLFILVMGIVWNLFRDKIAWAGVLLKGSLARSGGFFGA